MPVCICCIQIFLSQGPVKKKKNYHIARFFSHSANECRWTEALDRSDHLKLLAEMWKLKANLLQSSIEQWKNWTKVHLNKVSIVYPECHAVEVCCLMSQSHWKLQWWQPAIISDPFHSVDLTYWWTLEIQEKISSNRFIECYGSISSTSLVFSWSGGNGRVDLMKHGSHILAQKKQMINWLFF